MLYEVSWEQVLGSTSGSLYIELCFHGWMYPKQTAMAPIASGYKAKTLIQVTTYVFYHVTSNTANYDWITVTVLTFKHTSLQNAVLIKPHQYHLNMSKTVYLTLLKQCKQLNACLPIQENILPEC